MPKKTGEMTKLEQRTGFKIGFVGIGKRGPHWYWLCWKCSVGAGVEWYEDALKQAIQHRRECAVPDPAELSSLPSPPDLI